MPHTMFGFPHLIRSCGFRHHTCIDAYAAASPALAVIRLCYKQRFSFFPRVPLLTRDIFPVTGHLVIYYTPLIIYAL